MTQATPFHFQQLVPGLDFLQNLMKGAMQAQKDAGHAAPLGNWIAPTLSVEELDRRVSELKTVLYWLEQNAHAVKATIQALEVQRLTVAALSSMNVNLSDMAKAFRMPTLGATAEAADAAAEAPDAGLPAAGQQALASAFAPFAEAAKAFSWPLMGAGGEPAGTDASSAETPVPVPPVAATAPAAEPVPAPPAADAPQAGGPHADASEADAPQTDATPPLADPMNWWGTLTRQFQTLAGAALQGSETAMPAVAGMGQAAQDMLKAAQASALAGATAVTEQAAAMREATAQAVRQAGRATAAADDAPATQRAARKPASAAAKPVKQPAAKSKPTAKPAAQPASRKASAKAASPRAQAGTAAKPARKRPPTSAGGGR
ncbi:PhaM family polyhydroxyalkanoate granule multifunctional regulatory protein [Comamonas serinivorans]|nr:PhaM family polyhydroxyalkanoate granule multifunctional regulatory protein [Comamonas serinivorans]